MVDHTHTLQGDRGDKASIQDVKARFNRVQETSTSQRLGRLNRLHDSLEQCMQDFENLSAANRRALEGTTGLMDGFQSKLSGERQALQVLAGSTRQGLSELDRQISLQIQELRKARLDSTQDVLIELDEFATLLERQMSECQSSNLAKQQEENQSAALVLQRLQDTLDAQDSAQEADYAARLAWLREEAKDIEEAILAERQLREEMEKLLMSRIKDISSQIQFSLQAEAMERAKMHGTLSQLLAETMQRLHVDNCGAAAM